MTVLYSRMASAKETGENDEVLELMLSKREKEVEVYPSSEPEEEDLTKDSHDQKIRYLVTSLICLSFLCLVRVRA